ncbi:MAG TPA: right-handed parallel beta-helix repeat-containing protein [Geothrix sp.]|nr:right-handed parallel beta-helix repeat-containing protein [Geothrix sp.]HJV47736.1 right-handed parallel beta-helix repeat-containing protein [Geothrix sp.]
MALRPNPFTIATYLAPYLGSVGIALYAWLNNGTVIPELFGAKGDGVTDDHAALQAALNTGRNVEIPDKTYLNQSGLNFTANYQRFSGRGGASKILCTAGAVNNGVNMLTATGLTGCVVDSVMFENSGFGITMPAQGVYAGMGCGVTFINCDNCHVINSFFRKCGGNGQGVASVYFSSSRKCQAIGNDITLGMNGVNSDTWYYAVNPAAKSIGNLVADNTIYSNYGFAIVVDISDSNGIGQDEGDNITGNVLYNNKYGIAVTGQRATITSNLIDMNNYSIGGVGWDGICITGTNITVENNQIWNAYRSGIIVYANNLAGTGVPGYPTGGLAARDIRLINNEIGWDTGVGAGDATSHGIYVVNGSQANAISDLTIRGNKVLRARGYGAYLNGATYTLNRVEFDANKITSAGATGIKIAGIYPATLAVRGNNVALCAGSGYDISSATQSIIANNASASNANHGFLISGCGRTTFTGNRSLDNGSAAANTYDAVQFTASSGFSIITSNILGNVSTANTRYGVNLNDAASGGYLTSANVYPATATASYNETVTYACTRALENENGRREVWVAAMPAAGSWTAQDMAWNTASAELGAAGSKYIIQGWKRLTTGAGNVLNVDWLQMRTLTGN